MASIPETAWDALLDEESTPFLRWAWLEALEHAGCAAEDNGWQPCHLALWDGERLVAAAPAYLKADSDGDFSRDWGWADAAARARIEYYPKLILTVPFTPVTGRRIIAAPGFDRAIAVAALVEGARQICKEGAATSVHVLFPLASEAAELERAGLTRRVSFQYHWKNNEYKSPEDFLSRFDSKRRNQAKRERAAPAEQGIVIRTIRNPPIEWAKPVFELHRHTVDKMSWGRRWLDREFYQRIFQRMHPNRSKWWPRRKGRPPGGGRIQRRFKNPFVLRPLLGLFGRSSNFSTSTSVCITRSTKCIQRGVRVFEGCAGTWPEHKLQRWLRRRPRPTAPTGSPTRGWKCRSATSPACHDERESAALSSHAGAPNRRSSSAE